jgi:uncharacterized protein with NRDE domain
VCLALLALDAHPGYRFVFAGNRDEAYARPAAPAHFWPDAPHVLGGRDEEAGGAWLGITRQGRFALVTNIREPGGPRSGVPSRGGIVADFLRGREAPLDFARKAVAQGGRYNGFNLVTGDGDCWVYCSNRAEGPVFLAPGLYGLSNARLDAPWPKVLKAKRRAEAALDLEGEALVQRLFHILGDREIFPDASLPATGLSLEAERALSPVFTSTESYGTRCSTVILVDRAGTVFFAERTFDRSPETWTQARYEFKIEA